MTHAQEAQKIKDKQKAEKKPIKISKVFKWTKAVVALILLSAAGVRWAMLESNNQTIMFGVCGILIVGCVISVGEVLFNKEEK